MHGSPFQKKEAVITAGKMLGTAIADILFPKTCIGCGREGTFLCDACLLAVPIRHEHGCPFCRHRTPLGMTCLSCSDRHALDGIFSATPYRGNSIVEDAIHVMKYEFVAELCDPLGRFLSEAVSRSELPLPEIIIPVPLHPWRLRFRGFNQSARIAASLAAHLAPYLDVPVREDILIRNRFTLPQARSHDTRERQENLREAFSVSEIRDSKTRLKNATVWLVDDVATTGATLEECAKALKKTGAKKVFGIVVAR